MLSCSDNLSGGTIVRYDEFRGQLEAALERNSLHFHGLQRVETIELANTLRHWKVCALGAAPPSTEPFHVSAEIGFAWTRVDLWLRARLPYGSTMAMPVYGELLFDQAKGMQHCYIPFFMLLISNALLILARH
jgi:hypothetical protein